MQAVRPPCSTAATGATTRFTIMNIFFAFFYTAVVFNPVDVADNLKKYGGFIPGIRPGKNTAQYIERVLTRITFGGALYLCGRVHDPRAAPEVPAGAVPLRRHRPADRRRRRARHRSADRVAPDHAQLRRLRWPEGAAHPRPHRRAFRLSGVGLRSERLGLGAKLKSRQEIGIMREAGLIVRAILDDVCRAAVIGTSTWELDQIARRGIDKHRVTARSSAIASPPYPAVLCTSINEVVVHGIPSKKAVLADGDVIGIDFGIF